MMDILPLDIFMKNISPKSILLFKESGVLNHKYVEPSTFLREKGGLITYYQIQIS